MNQAELFRSDAKISHAVRRCASLMLELLPANYERDQAIRALRKAQSHALMADAEPMTAAMPALDTSLSPQVREELDRARAEVAECRA